MKAKIGSYETTVEIEDKYGLKFIHLGDEYDEGTVIRFAGKNVGYIAPSHSHWIDEASRKEIYEELKNQVDSGRVEYSDKDFDEYREYLSGCLIYDKELDPEAFRKKIDKMHLMEDLK